MTGDIPDQRFPDPGPYDPGPVDSPYTEAPRRNGDPGQFTAMPPVETPAAFRTPPTGPGVPPPGGPGAVPQVPGQGVVTPPVGAQGAVPPTWPGHGVVPSPVPAQVAVPPAWPGGSAQTSWAAGAPPPYTGGDLYEIGRTLARPGRRVVAKLIDIVVSLAATTGLWLLLASEVLEPVLSGRATTTADVVTQGVVPFVSMAALSLAVWVVLDVGMVATFGGSIGKLVCGLRVVGTDGRSVGPGGAARRSCLQGIAAALVVYPVFGAMFLLLRGVVAVVNLVMILDVTNRRRDIYDRLGGTYVVTRRH